MSRVLAWLMVLLVALSCVRARAEMPTTMQAEGKQFVGVWTAVPTLNKEKQKTFLRFQGQKTDLDAAADREANRLKGATVTLTLRTDGTATREVALSYKKGKPAHGTWSLSGDGKSTIAFRKSNVTRMPMYGV